MKAPKFLQEILNEILWFMDEAKIPALGGIIGSFIGIAIAKLIGIV